MMGCISKCEISNGKYEHVVKSAQSQAENELKIQRKYMKVGLLI